MILSSKVMCLKTQVGNNFYNSNLEKISDSKYDICLIDETLSYMKIERIPQGFNFLDRIKWILNLEKKLFLNKSFKRIFYNKELCVWIYSNIKVNKKIKWSVVEKVELLKKLCRNVNISEVWVIREGDRNVCVSLLKGKIVFFKVMDSNVGAEVAEISDYMSDKYSFKPYIRTFGDDVEINSDYSYSNSEVEVKTKLSIGMLAFSYLKSFKMDFYCYVTNSIALSLLILFSSYISINNKILKKDILINQKQILDLNNKLSNIPNVNHIKQLMSFKSNVFSFTQKHNKLSDKNVSF
ncbi:hypothetical protein [Candidatus Nesciobacter abundans]|uniref:Uncharacterized protein n=1 Tax=Candidatus Nesciobacter abundans TaxID=2601668 RepID=A0A5C0UH12_9PROT|nr:hypothetical protein [Candidatus Nesciobacter abundans]QEK38833.1 hypothetical protein FZC36_00015 [Candidatus Nesciobacter abundans]